MKRTISLLIFTIAIVLSGIFTVDNGLYMAKKDDIKEKYSENLVGYYETDSLFLTLQKDEKSDKYTASVFSRSMFIDRFLLAKQVDEIKLEGVLETSVTAKTQNYDHEFMLMKKGPDDIEILHVSKGNQGIIKRSCYLAVIFVFVLFVYLKNKKTID